MHMNILSEKNNDKNYVKAKIQKGLQNPKYQEKLRNARLCNNDKNPIHLPRQDRGTTRNSPYNGAKRGNS